LDDLYFRLNGKAFEEGYRLDKVSSGLAGLQDVFDGTYKTLTGKARISRKEREKFYLSAHSFEEGSFITLFGAIFTGVQGVLPLFYQTDTKSLLEYTFNAYEFLKDIFTDAHQGNTATITNNGEGTQVVFQDNSVKTYNGPVYQIGQNAINGYRTLDDLLEGDIVKSIQLGQGKEKRIEMKSENKGLFIAPIKVDHNPKTLQCDIYDFNKYDKVGKLKVYKEQEINEGNYRFKVIGGQEIEEYILSMTESRITVNCLIEYVNDPLSETKIGSLLIINIAA